MFPFQQGDELFQIPSITHPDYNNIDILQQQNQQDPYHNNIIPMTTTPLPTGSIIHQAPHFGRTGRRRKSTLIPASENTPQHGSSSAAGAADHDAIRNESDRRKEVHREIERQRRQEMSNLYSSLRSQLPVEYIKGKRSISDHMNEAVSYIKHLEKRIREMSLKRDELKRCATSRLPNEAMNNSSPSGSSSRINHSFVQVSTCWGGVEIVITSGFTGPTTPLPVSNVLSTLQEDGFIVFGYVSAIVNENVVYTIRAQVGDGTWVDIRRLQEKLVNVIIADLARTGI